MFHSPGWLQVETLLMTSYGKGKLVYVIDLSFRIELIKVHLLPGDMVMVRMEDLGFDHFRCRPTVVVIAFPRRVSATVSWQPSADTTVG